MKKKITVFILAVLLLACLILGISCSGKSGSAKIRLDRTEIVLSVGESVVICAETEDTNAKIEWSVTEKGIADVYNGLVKGIGVGTAEIEAKIGGAKEKASCKITVKEKSTDELETIRAYTGSEDIFLMAGVDGEYNVTAEKFEKGAYQNADRLLKDKFFSASEAGVYRITYRNESRTLRRIVYIETKKAYEDYFVVDELDGATKFLSHVSQSSVDVLTNPECGETYSEYVEENVSGELAAAGYTGRVHNDMLYRIEKEVVQSPWGGTYFYFEIAPRNIALFDKLDTFDDNAYLSVWYRMRCDTDGNGYKPVNQCYNYFYRENASGLNLLIRNQGVSAAHAGSGWFNWKIPLSVQGSLAAAKRLVFNIGQWAVGGKFCVDLYSVEIVSPLLEELQKGREVYADERIEYALPNPGLDSFESVLTGIYTENHVLEEGTDYELFDYAGTTYIRGLAPGNYELKYRVSADGIEYNAQDCYEFGSSLTVIPRINRNPAVLAGNEQTSKDVSYFQSTAWGTIESDLTTTVATITDSDYEALKQAGYRGVLNKRTVNRANVKATSVNGDETRGAFGFLFNYTKNHSLFKNGADETLNKAYYLSVWVKASETIGSDTRLAAYDYSAHKQATGGADMWVTFNKGEWTEILLPAETFQNVYFWLKENGGDKAIAGIYMASILAKSDLTVDIYSAELLPYAVAAEEGKNADIRFFDGILGEGESLKKTQIFRNETPLEIGIDYTIENGFAKGLQPGIYEVRYYICGNYVLENSYFSKRLEITRALDSSPVIDDMKNASETVKIYREPTSADSRKLSDCTKTKVENGQISEEEYTSLLNAGYKGQKSDKTVAKVRIGALSGRTNLYVDFTKSELNEPLLNALKNNSSDAYISIWIRSNQAFSFETYGCVFGNTTQYAALLGSQWVEASTVGVWTEIRISLAVLKDTSWYEQSGKLKAGEGYSYGFAFYNAADEGYLSGATIDIYSVEVKEGNSSLS